MAGFLSTPGDVRSLRIHGTIARDLGIDIVSGRYAANEILLGEIEASERSNVSRTAYREAIRILAAKGLVESRPKTGTRITNRSYWHLLDPEVLSWIFQSDPDIDLLKNLFELRSMIEPQAAALAAERRTDEELDALRTALNDMAERTLYTEEGRLADRMFHTILLQATRNAFLVSLASGITAAIAWTSKYKGLVEPRRFDADPLPGHQRVVDAVAARDPNGARSAMLALVIEASSEAMDARLTRDKLRSEISLSGTATPTDQ